MEIGTRSGKILDSMDDATKEVMLENKSDKNPKVGMKPIVPMLNENMVVEENSPNLEEVKVYAPPHDVIFIEEVKDKSILKSLMSFPKCPPPYLQQMIKKKEDNRFKKFIDLFSKLFVNIPLVDDLLQMSGYAKFMKELLKKKCVVDVGTMEVLHHFCVIMESNLAPKTEDP